MAICVRARQLDRVYSVYGLSGASCARAASSCLQDTFVGLAFPEITLSCHSPLVWLGRTVSALKPASGKRARARLPSHSSASLLPLPLPL